jgi:general stress protein CsbA
MRVIKGMQRLRRDCFVATLCMIGLLEAAYVTPYGIQWLIIALGATGFLAGFWIRTHWDA